MDGFCFYASDPHVAISMTRRAVAAGCRVSRFAPTPVERQLGAIKLVIERVAEPDFSSEPPTAVTDVLSMDDELRRAPRSESPLGSAVHL